MSTIDDTPENYLLFNEQQTKNVSIVVEIAGLDLISSRAIFTRIRYGDPGIVYGGTGLVYGGLRKVEGVRDILSFTGGSMVIAQKLEPEQGRASVSMMTLAFIDKDGYMSKAISPGILIPDILGAEVKVHLGFAEISYPEDFTTIFRGRVTSASSMSGRVVLQLSDPNVIRRQNAFFCGKTTTTVDYDVIDTIMAVNETGDFTAQILGPDGSYDTNVQTWIKVEDEYMQYSPPSGILTPTSFFVVRSTVDPYGNPQTIAAHPAGSDVSGVIVLKGNPIDLALKIMLSGWGGPYRENIVLSDIMFTGDLSLGSPTNALILPVGKSWTRDYGASAGDYLTVSAATNGANDVTKTIVSFGPLFGDEDRIAYMSSPYTTLEHPTPALVAIRSQYDTLPDECGSQLLGDEVDVDQHVYIRNTFLGSEAVRIVLEDQESAKSFIESELYLPFAAYSLTRQGKLSVGLTNPPIANERIQILDKDSILSPQTITPVRATNNRKFYNEIDWQFDIDSGGNFGSLTTQIDLESLGIIGISSILPINSRGGRTDLGYPNTISRRSNFLLSRYKRGAVTITCKINYQKATLIEVGDVVIVKDEGNLQITNFATGERNLGVQMFEVLNRTLDISNGSASVDLVSGLQTNIQDKFATFSPSSLVVAGSTNATIKIKDSFGSLFPGDEQAKWTDYIGLRIRVHDYGFTRDEETTLIGFSPTDGYTMLVDPPLSFVPSVNDIVDPPEYPDTTDAADQALWKLINVFWDPSLAVTSGASATSFNVSSGDALKFQIGQYVYLHNVNYSPVFGSQVLSNEVTVESIVGTLITVKSTLGYTPSAGQIVELIGFPDGGAPYRWL